MSNNLRENIPSMFFRFYEWKKCFAVWRENLHLHENQMRIVVSTHPYTSGYWIEDIKTELMAGDRVYTGKKVFDLEKRIEKEVDMAKKEGRSPKFIK